MKHRESIWKENIDIKRVLERGSVPFQKAWYERLKSNKNKIGLFFALCGGLSLQTAYTCIDTLNSHRSYCGFPEILSAAIPQGFID